MAILIWNCQRAKTVLILSEESHSHRTINHQAASSKQQEAASIKQQAASSKQQEAASSKQQPHHSDLPV
jgi:hypothetical protein